MSYGETTSRFLIPSQNLTRHSFDPAAEKTCEELLQLALQTDPDNTEALQALASVRLSQQRVEEAQQCLEQAWVSWKDLDQGLSSTALDTYILTKCSSQMTLEYHLYQPGYPSSRCSSRWRSTNQH